MAEKDYKSYTENYNLIKPGDLEKYDIEEVTRTNADIIDAELNKHEIAIKNLHNYDDTSIKKDIQSLEKAQQTCAELINNKVSIEEGKDLSTNDFTNTYKQKLDELQNYDDTEVVQEIRKLQQENIELKRTQDDMIEKQLNKQSEVDTSVIAKDTDEFYGKLSIFGGQRQDKRDSSRNICQSQANFWEVGMYNTDGQKTQITSRIRVKELTPVTPNAELYFNTFNDSCMFVIRRYDENKAFISSIGIVNNGQKIKMAENVNYLSVTIFNSNNDVSGEADNMLNKIKSGEIKPFICLSSEENKEFEEYGVKPSMYDPSEIEAVGDNVQLFDKDNATIINALLQASTMKLIANSDEKTLIFKCDSNTTYTISKIAGARLRVAEFENEPKINDIGKNYKDNDKATSLEYTTSNTAQYLVIGYAYTTSTLDSDEQAILDSIKVEKGTKATSYSEYGQGSVEISTSNKNVLEETFNDKTKTNQFSSIVRGNFVLKENMTYTVSFDTNNNSGQVYINEALFNTAQRRGCNGKRQTITATAKKSGNFINEAVIKTALTVENAYDISNVQIELADTNSDYTPHKGETLVMPIQQKMFENDCFEKIDGVWYEKHNFANKILSNTDNWLYQNVNEKLTRYSLYLSDTISESKRTQVFSNCFQFLENQNINRNIFVYEKYLYVYSDITNIDDFKNALKNNEAYIYYPLESAEYIKCTDEQSAILDKIDTYKDGTIITTDNDLCKISLRYKQNLESRIEQIEKQLATEVAEEE